MRLLAVIEETSVIKWILRHVGDFLHQNPAEALFQGEGNIALYNNLFVNRYGDAVHIQPHNDVPRSIDVFYNTILATGAGVAVRYREGESNPERQTVQANVVSAAMPISGAEARENITGPNGGRR